MSTTEESDSSQPKVPKGLTLEEACEIGRKNAIQQLQSDVYSLSTETTNITTRLDEVLIRFTDDLGERRRRNRISQKG